MTQPRSPWEELGRAINELKATLRLEAMKDIREARRVFCKLGFHGHESWKKCRYRRTKE
jgi:hypothetical protein